MIRVRIDVSRIFALLAACSLMFCTLPLQGNAAEGELFLASGSTKVVFPECGIQGSPACDYPLSLQVYNVDWRMSSQIPELRVLPTPLLSTISFGLDIDPEVCPLRELTAQLRNWKAQSEERQEFLATGVPGLLEPCFEGGLTYSSKHLTILLWKQGEVHGWIKCQGLSCYFQLHPPESSFQVEELQFGLRIDLISYLSLSRFVANLGDVTFNLMAPAPANIREQYRRLQIAAPSLDSVAVTMLRDADALGRAE